MSKKTRYFVMIAGAVLVVGLGTGLVASYLGMPVSVFSRAAGPGELQFVPADAAVVAYANVRDVMNSEFRQRLRRMEPSSGERNDFEARTGVNFEQDIDSVVAAMMPLPNDAAGRRQESALLVAKGRFETGRLEALAVEHGGVAEDYQGKRVLTHHETGTDGKERSLSLGFIGADVIAIGTTDAVRRAIDAGREQRNILSNTELMRLVGELDDSNAWAVGRFDAVASQANLPAEIQSKMPTISWFSAAGHVNGGLNGVFRAEANDEAAAQNLRDVVRGFLALAKMQAGSKPGMQAMVDSLQLSGEGKTVALSFSVPSEVLDVIEGMAKSRRGDNAPH